jgi:hypothetical protein
MIVDMTGKRIARGKLAEGINTVDAGGLGGGIYLVRFSGNGQQWTEKFVRQ